MDTSKDLTDAEAGEQMARMDREEVEEWSRTAGMPHECRTGEGGTCGVRHRSRKAAVRHLEHLRQMYCQWCGRRACRRRGHRDDVTSARWYSGAHVAPLVTPQEPKEENGFAVHYDFGGYAFCGQEHYRMSGREEVVTCGRCIARLGRQDSNLA